MGVTEQLAIDEISVSLSTGGAPTPGRGKTETTEVPVSAHAATVEAALVTKPRPRMDPLPPPAHSEMLALPPATLTIGCAGSSPRSVVIFR